MEIQNEIKANDKQILQEIMKTFRMSAAKLSEKLGYKSHMSVYNVFNGSKQRINEDMVNRILINFPTVSPEFVRFGTGPVLKTIAKATANDKDNIDSISLESIEKRLSRVEQLLLKILGDKI